MAKMSKAEAGRLGGFAKRGKKMHHTLDAEQAKAALIKKIHEDQNELYAAWHAAAVGHFQAVEIDGKIVQVYKTKPNAAAIKDIFERGFGKPKQEIEATGKDGAPIMGVVILPPLADE